MEMGKRGRILNVLSAEPIGKMLVPRMRLGVELSTFALSSGFPQTGILYPKAISWMPGMVGI